jgi:hypothetical protein
VAEVNFLPGASSDYDDAFNWYFPEVKVQQRGLRKPLN